MQTNEEKILAKEVTPKYHRITEYPKNRNCVFLTSNATRFVRGFAFLCKLGLLLFKTHWDYKTQI